MTADTYSTYMTTKSHCISVSSPWFEYLREGQKQFEGRLAYKDYKDYQIGDELIVHLANNQTIKPFTLTIINIQQFVSFHSALKSLGIDRVLPGITSINSALQIYESFYTTQQQQQYGIIMIECKRKITEVDR